MNDDEYIDDKYIAEMHIMFEGMLKAAKLSGRLKELGLFLLEHAVRERDLLTGLIAEAKAREN